MIAPPRLPVPAGQLRVALLRAAPLVAILTSATPLPAHQ